MIKVITYGTYDLLHYGHIKLLERAKALGDYLIVGVTADDFDKSRGKINVQQSLMERIDAVRATGIADEIIIEEYEGQKIDDIQRLGIDIFTVGSDWRGKFDYLNEYCKVVYLDRTEGISSSEIRSERKKIKLGIVGEQVLAEKVANECNYVNGIEVSGVYTTNTDIKIGKKFDTFDELLDYSDALYIISHPTLHFEQIKKAIELKKHVLCEAPISLSKEQSRKLHQLSEINGCILMDALKTAYSTAYSRMLLLAKGGKIGKIISIDATATSLRDIDMISKNNFSNTWNSINAWGPTAMLPIFQILGTEYKEKRIISKMFNNEFDIFTKIDFIYDDSVATLKVGKGVKSEGELIISGTRGYIYVPAPWWKTDYFEIRYENPNDNKRYFYQLDGEGIRYELVAFLNAIQNKHYPTYISRDVSDAICEVIEDFYTKNDFIELT
ncbi:adenylyltransferase/cytidyltransferase family protein [Enterococcus cecorum]|uniref:adenylyltransferase/cytidyltransferase family protein n=1 Tax=Enterococcus cecorum TaxID=44008 RepID=UPI000B367F95|nr:adenylyltransferase/cytidyltransferase family protein [Enterococcus cecorum]OUN48439.1 glycerol-3-phosphate cytidylyltransferase [Enterococcus cecorum]